MFKDIYSFEALDKMSAGEIVKVFDRNTGEIVTVNDLTVLEFALMIRQSETEKGRYVFFATDNAAEKKDDKCDANKTAKAIAEVFGFTVIQEKGGGKDGV